MATYNLNDYPFNDLFDLELDDVLIAFMDENNKPVTYTVDEYIGENLVYILMHEEEGYYNRDANAYRNIINKIINMNIIDTEYSPMLKNAWKNVLDDAKLDYDKLKNSTKFNSVESLSNMLSEGELLFLENQSKSSDKFKQCYRALAISFCKYIDNMYIIGNFEEPIEDIIDNICINVSDLNYFVKVYKESIDKFREIIRKEHFSWAYVKLPEMVKRAKAMHAANGEDISNLHYSNFGDPKKATWANPEWIKETEYDKPL